MIKPEPINLTNSWQQYTFSWTDLSVPAWAEPASWDPSEVVGFAFGHAADVNGEDYEFFIDDLEFTVN